MFYVRTSLYFFGWVIFDFLFIILIKEFDSMPANLILVQESLTWKENLKDDMKLALPQNQIFSDQAK
jgi:hypothetical protein